MRSATDKPRYRVRDRRGDGKFFFDTDWTEESLASPVWFNTKAEAVAAWMNANQAAERPAEGQKRRGRPPKAEVETGIVEG